MKAAIYDPTPCALGEGLLWHPERGQLFWFDILKYRLYTRAGGETRHWQFNEHVSAAGWVDRDKLLVASETRLFTFNTLTGAQEAVAPLEADRPDTRSNDGRADPWGGFWIGTMSKSAEARQGAIYRLYRGEVRRLFPEITIPNAVAFTPDGSSATFADTAQRTVWRVRLAEPHGWPEGPPEAFLEHRAEALNPDGAVFDSSGDFWCAEWGASRVARYAADGILKDAIEIGAPHSSCPVFGGQNLSTLYCTTARQGLSAETLTDGRPHGATFHVVTDARGQSEHQVLL